MFNHIRSNNLEWYICDDIYFIILYFLKHDYCYRCHKWIGNSKIHACFFKNTTLCFRCRHKCQWPL